MKVLTVKQPWAWALIHGQKRIENRSWATSYRGPLLIHAGKSHDSLGNEGDLFECPPHDSLIFGAIIGIVDLVDCVPLRDVVPFDKYAEGPVCWLVENPRPITPHYCSGAQSLWTPPADLVIAYPKMESLAAT